MRTVPWKDKCGSHRAQQFLWGLWSLVRGNVTLLSDTRITFGCCGTSWIPPLCQDKAGRSALWIQPLPFQVAVPAPRLWYVTNSHMSAVSWTRELILLKRKLNLFFQMRFIFFGGGWVTFVLFLKTWSDFCQQVAVLLGM